MSPEYFAWGGCWFFRHLLPIRGCPPKRRLGLSIGVVQDPLSCVDGPSSVARAPMILWPALSKWASEKDSTRRMQ